MLGGLLSLHKATGEKQWGDFSAKEFGRAEAVIFAINSINKNSSLLPNVLLGHDIRNYCDSRAMAMQIPFDFQRNRDPFCMYRANASTSVKSNSTRSVGSKPTSALTGPSDSASVLLVASLLKVAAISAIISTATTIEFYNDFFRPAPSDKLLVKAMADIIELF